jgi:hypothetical protein
MAGATLLAASIPAAVWLGEDLHLDGLCDAEFLARANNIARGKARLHRLPQRISVTAARGDSLPLARSEASRRGEGQGWGVPHRKRTVGCSFSGGVDSKFTLQQHLDPNGFDPIGALVTVFGIDLKWSDEAGHERELAKLLPVSQELGLAHYTVSTNFRDVFDPLADWSLYTHGACVISVGFLLSGSLHTYLVASSASIDRLYPWGSHALLDNAFLSSELTVKNDAWEWHRNEKIEHIANWSLGLRHLRVCNKMRPVGNCCECEKCVRTMTLLMLCGKLEEAESFPRPLTLDQLSNFRIKRDAELFWYGQMRQEAERRGLPDVARALDKALRGGRLRVARRGLQKKLLGRYKRVYHENE